MSGPRPLQVEEDVEAELSPLMSSKQGTPHGGAPRSESSSGVVLPGVVYVATSASLILLNKHALASFDFSCPNSILLFHCVLAVVLVKGAELLGLVRLERIRWKIVRVWLPVNLLFVGMIATSYFALTTIGVGMFTLLKNLSNFITIIGDWYFFNRTYNMQVWSSLMLMVGSALAGAATDMRFDATGYLWQLLNCCFTSAYALYLSSTMDRAAQHTSDGKRLSEFSMVYYNNLLSIGPVLILIAVFGEMPWTQPALHNLEFQLVVLAGGLLGFGISFTSLWYISRTTATVYSLTGSLNKIIVAVFGIILFREITSFSNIFSIVMGLLAGIVFVLAKSKPN